MKKVLFSILLLFISIACLKAQTAAKCAYVELGGPGLASINYDTRFSKTEGGLGGRIGIGGFSIRDAGTVVTVPVGLNYLLGKDGKNYFEIGAGYSYVHASTSGDVVFGDGGNSSASFGHLSFGYRLQPANGGFTFRAAVVPIFGSGFFIPYYAGLSFGYKF